MTNIAPWAHVEPAAYNVECPHCGESYGAPDNGSHLWIMENFAQEEGKVHQCGACEQLFRIRKPRARNHSAFESTRA